MTSNLESHSTGNSSHVTQTHVEYERELQKKIRSNFEKLSETDQALPQLIILYSDSFCPILKYHTELILEISRVLPSIIGNERVKESKNGCKPENQQLPNTLAIVLSPKPDRYINATLAEPFQISRIDRTNLASIQVEGTPHLKNKIVVDDSWACLQEAKNAPLSWQSMDDIREHYFNMLADECSRLEGILTNIDIPSNDSQQTKPIEVICVLDQSESELYGAPTGIKCKVIFVVSKVRKDQSVNTVLDWIDRIFLKSGYSIEWINSNVIPLYIELPDEPSIDLDGQRPESSYVGAKIRLSAKRPVEAYTRNKVRQGNGDEILEKSVLGYIQKTQLFEMQAIRKPLFLQLMGSMSLDNKASEGGTEGAKTEPSEENPFVI